MTVPQIDEFSEVIELLRNFHAQELSASLETFFPANYEGDSNETEQIVERIIKDSFSLWDQKYQKIISTTASKWISDQPGTKAALKKRDRKRTSRTAAKEITRRVSAIMDANRNLTLEEIDRWRTRLQQHGRAPTENEESEHIAHRNSHEYKISRIRYRTSKYLNETQMTWECGIYSALKNYYFTDRWERLYEEAKNKKLDFQAAQRGLASLELASCHLISPLSTPGLERIAKSVKKEIEEKLRFGIDTLYPLHRKDNTSRERVLAYDFFINNKIHNMGRKSSLISNLMMIEGIENPLDLRTIERLIATWDAALSGYDTKVALSRK